LLKLKNPSMLVMSDGLYKFTMVILEI